MEQYGAKRRMGNAVTVFEMQKVLDASPVGSMLILSHNDRGVPVGLVMIKTGKEWWDYHEHDSLADVPSETAAFMYANWKWVIM